MHATSISASADRSSPVISQSIHTNGSATAMRAGYAAVMSGMSPTSLKVTNPDSWVIFVTSAIALWPLGRTISGSSGMLVVPHAPAPRGKIGTRRVDEMSQRGRIIGITAAGVVLAVGAGAAVAVSANGSTSGTAEASTTTHVNESLPNGEADCQLTSRVRD